MEELVGRPSNGKKRKVVPQPESWKKAVEKRNRHKASTLPTYPTCAHKDSKLYDCHKVRMADLKFFHQLFYQKPEKVAQDQFLIQHIRLKSVKRQRVIEHKYKERVATAEFFLRKVNHEEVRMCRKAFTEILGITARRISFVIKKFREEGNVDERRGGFRKQDLFDEKRSSVTNFLNQLTCFQSHYCRGKRNRKYLPADLNINKLYKHYTESTEGDILVKESYFRMIFNTQYNFGFGSPRSDVCSTCLQLEEQIKNSRNETEKTSFQTNLQVHKKRAAAFYELLQDESPKKLILSFDCQKNIAMPHLPDQSVYYYRQFYIYNFTVVKGNSHQKLTPENVTSFMWTENEFSKDSNAISSAVFSVLRSSDFSQYDSVRLVSDGCGGQNKNTTIVAMVMKWLAEFSPINVNTVELVFPVTGHSFIPPDRVFALIEKEFKKTEVMTTVVQVHNIVAKHATVKKLGSDCQVYNFKDDIKGVVRKCRSWHFQISKCKRIIFRRSTRNSGIILARGETTFKSDLGIYKSLLCPKMTLKDIHLTSVNKVNIMTAAKKTDVDKLLKNHFGDEWRSLQDLQFYASIIDGSEDGQQEELECEPMDPDENNFV